MGKIIKFRKVQSKEYVVSELICLKCLRRWIAVYPRDTPLSQIECKCGEVGYVIHTGQELD